MTKTSQLFSAFEPLDWKTCLIAPFGFVSFPGGAEHSRDCTQRNCPLVLETKLEQLCVPAMLWFSLCPGPPFALRTRIWPLQRLTIGRLAVETCCVWRTLRSLSLPCLLMLGDASLHLTPSTFRCYTLCTLWFFT